MFPRYRGYVSVASAYASCSADVFLTGGLVRSTKLIVLLALTTTGCFEYAHVEDAAPLPEPGKQVRVQLAAPQRLELGSVTVNDVSRIEGDVYQSDGDTLAIFSRKIFSSYGGSHFTNGAVFYFNRSEFGRLEQRKVLPVATGIAASAATVGIVAATYLAIELGGGGEGPGSRDAPEQSRVFRIPLVWFTP